MTRTGPSLCPIFKEGIFKGSKGGILKSSEPVEINDKLNILFPSKKTVKFDAKKIVSLCYSKLYTYYHLPVVELHLPHFPPNIHLRVCL